MISEFAISHQNPTLVILSLALSAATIAIQLFLSTPLVFNWRHARNLHAISTIFAFATSFFTFVAVFMTRFTVSAAMSGISTVSLNAVETKRGSLSEAFLWVSAAFWFVAFWFMWWVRWWEILEKRDTKDQVLQIEIERRENQEEAKKLGSRRAVEMKPMNPGDDYLSQFPAAQM